MPVISALRSLRQEDQEVSLDASVKTLKQSMGGGDNVTATPRIYLLSGCDN